MDRCETTLRLLSEAGFRGSVQQELRVQLNRCYNVRNAVERSDYVEANRELKLLARKILGATWIDEMIESVQVCLDQVESVKAGPVGLLDRPSFMPSTRQGSLAMGHCCLLYTSPSPRD